MRFRKEGSTGSRLDRKHLMLIAEAVKGNVHTHTHSAHALDTTSQFIATPTIEYFLKFEPFGINSDLCLSHRAAH